MENKKNNESEKSLKQEMGEYLVKELSCLYNGPFICVGNGQQADCIRLNNCDEVKAVTEAVIESLKKEPT